jgi:predicted N-acyltransferase
MQSASQSVAHGNAPAPLPDDWRVEIVNDPARIDAARWNALLARQACPTPFMRHEYLAALHASGSAVPRTGWTPQFLLLWDGAELAAACPLYLKAHSYGEYVFDWAWANAYAEHGLDYYPKALVAVPFTPVPGSRLLARDAAARTALLRTLLEACTDNGLSSLHVLYGDDTDVAACESEGLMLRQQVQFHWKNHAPDRQAPFTDFEDFLASLARDKRKKIRQERRRVHEAGVRVRWARGTDITPADWAFFYRCYERTYLEHGNAPYLTPAFFDRMARELPQAWVLFVAERDGHDIAASLIAVDTNPNGHVAYGRYWGALERVDCLHFELCYYAPLAWCIAHGVRRFEGGAQGEHKMARALLPVTTHSAHWLAHPAFAEAVGRFLEREDEAVARYMAGLRARNPFGHTPHE